VVHARRFVLEWSAECILRLRRSCYVMLPGSKMPKATGMSEHARVTVATFDHACVHDSNSGISGRSWSHVGW